MKKHYTHPEPITRERIDELIQFAPAFEAPGREFYTRWEGGDKNADGVISMPYPVYPADVEQFFRLLGQTCWLDFDYNPERAGVMLNDDALIAQATLDEIRTMFTYCLRGERFSDGFWGSVLERGRVQLVLRRLLELRDTIAD